MAESSPVESNEMAAGQVGLAPGESAGAKPGAEKSALWDLLWGAIWLTALVGLTWLVIGSVAALRQPVGDKTVGDGALVVPAAKVDGWTEAAVGAASCLVAGWLVFGVTGRYLSVPDRGVAASVTPLLVGMMIRPVVVFAGIGIGVLAGFNQTMLFWVSFVACYLVSLAFEAVWLVRRS
jgi:hypothetical protein